MGDLVIRRATADDAPVLAALIDGFAKGHSAEGHPRSTDKMRGAFFGGEPLAQVLLAERNGTAIGFAAWRKTFDVYWSMYGGEGVGFYVRPEHRGSGVALSLVAVMCAEIRAQGGHFLAASYGEDVAKLYERVGIGGGARACHISALAFETLADASGKPIREIVRSLPEKSQNLACAPVSACILGIHSQLTEPLENLTGEVSGSGERAAAVAAHAETQCNE